jgi:hypothetical protein
MTSKQRKAVEQTLAATNMIHGKGIILAVVWGGAFAGVTITNRGIAVRQFQYGMDAREFIVSLDGTTVRFLGHTRLVLREVGRKTKV